MGLFDELLGGGMKRVFPPVEQAKRVPVGEQMLAIAEAGVEWYKPVYSDLPLLEEGGASEPSYKNLCLLIDKLGKPCKVERTTGGGILVTWPDDKHYLATGFEVGYFGTGPHYLACFGEKAGFGDRDDLYMAVAVMDREKTTVIWER